MGLTRRVDSRRYVEILQELWRERYPHYDRILIEATPAERERINWRLFGQEMSVLEAVEIVQAEASWLPCRNYWWMAYQLKHKSLKEIAKEYHIPLFILRWFERRHRLYAERLARSWQPQSAI
jgi:hypothetical protein